ncbi:MAG: tyrosine--tRNA ligase [Planctomycetota bacterium]|nr:MAG: tyrosine--tRNA ligase [Planctomycetota bacterium]
MTTCGASRAALPCSALAERTPLQDIIADLKWRGLVHQQTDEKLAAWLGEKSRTLYAGFDPTADSLHVGSLIPLLMLRRFQKAGHRPIALVGGATGMIGDPSGKSEERNLLDVDALAANVAGIEAQMRMLLDFEGDRGAKLVNNFDWMRSFSYLDFLRDVGKNFPVSVMMAKDSVKTRLGRDDVGISYTEFSYMLLQAYDFVHLHEQFGCELQLGASDQWGNITAGIDLARRMKSVQLYGLTCPLLTKSDGAKMGKTESGTVWLSPSRTSPYAFYQYWINVDDADAGKCLRFLTELEQKEVEALDAARESDPGKRESQKRLAEELTRMIHGDAGLATARRATEIFFGAEISELSDAQLGEIFADVPSQQLARERLEGEGLNVVDALVEASLAGSKSDARRTVAQGGAYVNNRRVENVDAQLGPADLASETVMVLRSGKKKYALLRFKA